MDVFTAIADPVRRAILAALTGGPQPAGEVAAAFSISRPAISRHLRVLREAKLVSVVVVGREHIYQLDTPRLDEVRDWVDGFSRGSGRSWDQRLDALGTEVRRTTRERRQQPATQPVQEETA